MPDQSEQKPGYTFWGVTWQPISKSIVHTSVFVAAGTALLLHLMGTGNAWTFIPAAFLASLLMESGLNPLKHPFKALAAVMGCIILNDLVALFIQNFAAGP